jgi:hypothetical protein
MPLQADLMKKAYVLPLSRVLQLRHELISPDGVSVVGPKFTLCARRASSHHFKRFVDFPYLFQHTSVTMCVSQRDNALFPVAIAAHAMHLFQQVCSPLILMLRSQQL